MSRTLIKEGLKALREQGSLMDFVNRVAPPGGRVRDTISNISNRVTGGNSSTSSKKPGYNTLNNYLNRRGGYTSKNKMFYYDDHGDVSYGEMTGGIGPTIYYGSKGGSAYGGNDRKDGRGIAILDDSPYERGITTRSFGRGGEFKTITGTGRSREGDAAKEVTRRRRDLGEQDFSGIFDLINYSGKQRTVPTTKELSASLASSGRQAKPIGTTTYQGFTVPVGPDVGVYQERQPGGPQPVSIQPGYLDAVERYNQMRTRMANKRLTTRKPTGAGGGGF